MTDSADDTDHHPQAQQTGDDQVRSDDGKVEVAHVQQAAFIGHVEFPAFGENHGHQRRQYQVERQHDIVDFAPEAVTIATVHARADIDREEQMRQRIGDNQAGRGVDDIQVEQQVGQRCGDKDHPRQGELIIEHGAEIAQALLERQPTAQ